MFKKTSLILASCVFCIVSSAGVACDYPPLTVKMQERNALPGDRMGSGCSTYTVTVKVKKAFVALRSGPGKRYRLRGRLSDGQVVTLIDVRGKWFGIAYATGDRSEEFQQSMTEMCRDAFEGDFTWRCTEDNFGWVYGQHLISNEPGLLTEEEASGS